MSNPLHILLVEDDDLIRDFLADVLENDGDFSVVVAERGEEAIAILETAEYDFRVLLTDVNLVPEQLTGWDVAKHARGLKPEFPVIYMTGAASSEWAIKGVPKSILLTKPFNPAKVLAALLQLLNAEEFHAGRGVTYTIHNSEA